MRSFQPALKSLSAKSSAMLPIFTLTIALLASGCGGSSGSSSGSGGTTPPPSTANEWTFMSGLNAINAPEGGNLPGSRIGAVSWTDNGGNLWLFGGGSGSAPESDLNDLWEFNPTTKTWTLASGSNGINAAGVYGSLGTGSTINVPGARDGAVSWIDSGGNLWLFGGSTYDLPNGQIAAPASDLNDLWEFDPTTRTWTWVSGSNGINAAGVYGSLGTGSTINVPGARDGAVSWIDSGGNLWLFGGLGYDSTDANGYLNDLWEFNPTNRAWRWVSGSRTANASGSYGTLGAPSASNTPGARAGAVPWKDTQGNLWLFGGGGTPLNDLWKFSPTTEEWTWVSGSSTANAAGVYGTQGVASTSNVPGARVDAGGLIDSNGNLWLFGGCCTSNRQLNDLWEFSPSAKTWTWVSGSSTAGAVGSVGQPGVYGQTGVASASNVPGGREGFVSWIDGNGNFWLFGGWGLDSVPGAEGGLNDLWRYQP
jgi:N-acetylneuraminic acid mutarotase